MLQLNLPTASLQKNDTKPENYPCLLHVEITKTNQMRTSKDYHPELVVAKKLATIP